MTDGAFDLQEQIARIARVQDEIQKLVEERHKLAGKLSQKRDRPLWQFAFGGMASGAMLVGATAVLIRSFS